MIGAFRRIAGARFTGERLHTGSELFDVDLARHLAAYRYAAATFEVGNGLDLGSGSGYGTAELAGVATRVQGVDRVAPDPVHRKSGCGFVRADLTALPFVDGSFDWAVSFQVIEHVEDPASYLDALARLLSPGSMALITTPNRLMSDGTNPFHVHEYTAAELEGLVAEHFASVKMLGVGATQAVLEFHRARMRRVERMLRVDVLGLRKRLPRPLIEWAYGRLAIVVRVRTRSHDGLPDVSWRDFPIGPPSDDCLDLLAVCTR